MVGNYGTNPFNFRMANKDGTVSTTILQGEIFWFSSPVARERTVTTELTQGGPAMYHWGGYFRTL